MAIVPQKVVDPYRMIEIIMNPNRRTVVSCQLDPKKYSKKEVEAAVQPLIEAGYVIDLYLTWWFLRLFRDQKNHLVFAEPRNHRRLGAT